MKVTKVFALSLVAFLCSCHSGSSIKEETHFLFDTMVSVSIKDGKKEDYQELKRILNKYDAVSDNFKTRDVFNVYLWSQTEEEVYFGDEPDKAPIELYYLVKKTFKAEWDASHLDVRIGSLVQKWKDAESKGQVLDNSVIQEELEKKRNSEYRIHTDDDPSQNYILQRGVESFDYGATAKGCALDACKEYLDSREDLTDYIINAGSSSILLGANSRNEKYGANYRIKIKDLDNVFFYAHDCFISTSGTSEQGATINGVRYSHIINPRDGNAVTNYDTVIVISNEGTYGDAFSTSIMFDDSIETIEELENNFNLKTIIIKDKRILHAHKDIVFA